MAVEEDGQVGTYETPTVYRTSPPLPCSAGHVLAQRRLSQPNRGAVGAHCTSSAYTDRCNCADSSRGSLVAASPRQVRKAEGAVVQLLAREQQHRMQQQDGKQQQQPGDGRDGVADDGELGPPLADGAALGAAVLEPGAVRPGSTTVGGQSSLEAPTTLHTLSQRYPVDGGSPWYGTHFPVSQLQSPQCEHAFVNAGKPRWPAVGGNALSCPSSGTRHGTAYCSRLRCKHV